MHVWSATVTSFVKPQESELESSLRCRPQDFPCWYFDPSSSLADRIAQTRLKGFRKSCRFGGLDSNAGKAFTIVVLSPRCIQGWIYDNASEVPIDKQHIKHA